MSTHYVLSSENSSPEKFAINYRAELNDEQYQVVTQGEGPCLVLAGAGSGKTRTLVYRVAYLIERGVPPERIMLVTFTNKAAKEMLYRVETLLQHRPKNLWGGTFHHIGNRMLRSYGQHVGVAKNFNILDEQDSKDLVKACVAEMEIGRDKYFPKGEVIQRIISLAANLNQSTGQVIAERFSYLDSGATEKILQIAGRYREKKSLAQTLDYDDLLTKWNELLQHSQLAERLRQKFSYVLVDEFQDTNAVQGEIILRMAASNSNILAVGDDSQSIYSFRGATVNNILSFPKLFTNAKIFKLETNYRSSPEILALANASIERNPNQFEKQLQTTKSAGSKPALVPLYDVYQQAEFICQRILELQRDEGVALSELAVLFRAHFQSLELELALNKRGIPYQLRGGIRFFEQAHIKDILAYLKASRSVADELSWLRVLRLQSGIGEVNARKIWERLSSFAGVREALSVTLAEFLAPKVQAGWEEVRALLLVLVAAGEQGPAEIIQVTLKSSYAKYVLANFENAADRLEDLKQLASFAGHYQQAEDLLADVALSEGFKGESTVGYEEGPEEAMTLSTVHQAKGLEWKVVFIIGLSDGAFPHAKVFEKPIELEEERRLFYVAVTRAKDQLYLTFPTVNARGDILSRPSQFLREVPPALFDNWQVERDEPVIQIDQEGEGILDKYLRQRSGR